MFDSALLRFQSDYGNTIGEILEALLYYNSVHVVINPRDVSLLISKLGLETFQTLVEIPHLTVSILPEFIGMHTTNEHIVSHSAAIARIFAEPNGRKVKLKDFAIEQIVSGTNLKINPKLEKLFTRKCRITSYSNLVGDMSRINSQISETINQRSSLVLFLEKKAQLGNYRFRKEQFQSFKYLCPLVDEKILTLSDDLTTLIDSNAEDFTWGHILNEVHSYWIECYLVSSVRSDLVTNKFYSDVSKIQINNALKSAKGKLGDIFEFQEFAFKSAKYFSEAIDGGELEIKDAIKFIMKNEKLRDWVKCMPPGANLMQEYFDKTNENDGSGLKAGKLITKAGFALGGAAIDGGILTGFLTNLVGDTVQNFFLERVLNKWSPSTFVQNSRSLISKY